MNVNPDSFPGVPLGGMQIIESALCVARQQFRFPRTKKRRTRAKWAAREQNFRSTPTAWSLGTTLYCHPAIAARLRADPAFKNP